MIKEPNPYYKLFDFIDKDFNKDHLLIEQFIQKSIDHYTSLGISPEESSMRIKRSFLQLDEIIIDRCINYKDFMQEKSIKEKLLKITEVADILNVTRQQVYNHINSGNLKETMIGASKRICSTEVDRFIKGQ